MTLTHISTMNWQLKDKAERVNGQLVKGFIWIHKTNKYKHLKQHASENKVSGDPNSGNVVVNLK